MGELLGSQLPMSVSQIPRRVGVSQQAIQRLADKMNASGFLKLSKNPRDKCSVRVESTKKGLVAYQSSREKESLFTNKMAEDFDVQSLNRATQTLEKPIDRFEKHLSE